jgi:hypothetical protein
VKRRRDEKFVYFLIRSFFWTIFTVDNITCVTLWPCSSDTLKATVGKLSPNLFGRPQSSFASYVSHGHLLGGFIVVGVVNLPYPTLNTRTETKK